jgi:hypothetical protein
MSRHGGHHADLLQEAHYVFFRPLLRQLPIRDSVNRDGRHCHSVAGAWRTRQIRLMFARRCQARDDLVAFRDLIFDLMNARLWSM